MAFASNSNTSVMGRRVGLQIMTSNVTGSGRAGESPDMLVGAEALRSGVNTGSTSRNLPAYGISRVNGTSAASSAVYTLDPPIPGVGVFLDFGSTTQGPIYVKTANGETFNSTQGTTFSVIKSTGNQVGTLFLVGVTTAIYGMVAGLSTATFALSTST